MQAKTKEEIGVKGELIHVQVRRERCLVSICMIKQIVFACVCIHTYNSLNYSFILISANTVHLSESGTLIILFDCQ